MFDIKNFELIQADSHINKEIVRKCQENIWLVRNGIAFEDDPCLELDSPYSFARVQSIEDLKSVFEHGNWSIRNGFLYGDLCFINQVDGGDEWWTLKYDHERKQWVAFESITFCYIIEDGSFETYIDRLEKATIEQCKKLEY